MKAYSCTQVYQDALPRKVLYTAFST